MWRVASVLDNAALEETGLISNSLWHAKKRAAFKVMVKKAMKESSSLSSLTCRRVLEQILFYFLYECTIAFSVLHDH